MSSFTQQLYLRHSGRAEAIRPRQRSLFEPVKPRTGYADMGSDISENPAFFQQPDSNNTPYKSDLPYFKGQDANGIPFSKSFPPQSEFVKSREEKDRSVAITPDKPQSPPLPIQNETNRSSPVASTSRPEIIQHPKEQDNRHRIADSIPQPEIKTVSTRKRNQTEPLQAVSPQLPYPDWKDSMKAAADAWLRQNTQPVIRVSIGRLEVRTTPAASATPAKSSTLPPRPRMSLEDYLNKQKNNGT